MIRIINENPVANDTERTDGKLYRTYRRLLATPTGTVNAHQFRKILGINGLMEHDSIISLLTDLEKREALTFDWYRNERGHMSYRLNLNSLPELGASLNAMNGVNVLEPGTQLMIHFSNRQEEVLGQRKTPTIKDRALGKRLLKDVALDVALDLVTTFWSLPAGRRNGANFGDFYFQYPQLLNDVLDDRQEDAKQVARDRLRDAPKKSRREQLIKEIEYRKKFGRPLMGLDKELEELDAEE